MTDSTTEHQAPDTEPIDVAAAVDESGTPDPVAAEAPVWTDADDAATVTVESAQPSTGRASELSEAPVADDPVATTVEPSVERATDPAPQSGGSAGDEAEDALDPLENEGEIAADYLEELLDIADLDGDLDMDVEGDRAAVSIVGGDIRRLVGQDGEVLEALQELTRLAVYRETGERSRLMLDIGGFRADKRTRLEKVAAAAVAEVKESGQRKALDAMSPFERKVVHDAVAAAGLSSSSEGEEPRRYVVVLPA